MKKILLSSSVIFLLGFSGIAQEKTSKKLSTLTKAAPQPTTSTKKVENTDARLAAKQRDFEAMKAAERTNPKLSKDSKP